MKELGEAINESLSDSEQIAEVVSRIKEGGYDIFLVLEATIGVSKQGEKSSDKTSLVTTLSTNPEFKISDQDMKFLKSLRIRIEEEKKNPDTADVETTASPALSGVEGAVPAGAKAPPNLPKSAPRSPNPLNREPTCPATFFPVLPSTVFLGRSMSMKDTLGVLLAGGAGERLYPLTRDRAKPAVTFGGMYRIIDITLSNCLNSDLRRVYILTQYKALSLNRHIREGWNILGREVKEFIEVLPPMKRVSDQWYQGTADAVYQNIYSIGSEQPKFVLILSGDHIYKMDYGKMMKQHLDSAVDITLATIQVDLEECPRFGVVDVDKDGRINGFEEKPKETKLRSPWNPNKVAGSMGVYLFNADVLIPVLLKDAEDQTSSHDFGKDILPKMVSDYRVFAYDFLDENKKEALYWRDVGTLEAYYEANMDIVSVSPIFNLY